jgi:hypothetical protein
MQNNHVKEIMDAIYVTAMMANELCVQSKGELLIPEEDYMVHVSLFKTQANSRIIAIQTKDDLKDEMKKYVVGLLSKFQEAENVGNDGVSKSDVQESIHDNTGKDA